MASANPGCALHLAAAGVDVRHPVELIAEADPWPVSSTTSAAGSRQIAEELADLAIVRLRESIDAGGTELPVDERRLTRARRAVEKAIAILREPDDALTQDGAWRRRSRRASAPGGDAEWSAATGPPLAEPGHARAPR